MRKFAVFVFLFAVFELSISKTIFENSIEPLEPSLGFSNIPIFANMLRRRCPVCDSSVYSYCSDKLFHDSCCCHNPNNPYDRVPYQCMYADCSFLHANTCAEHKLITACCCTNLYKK
ncbi:unnamed protein product [Brassicogethes aeneus]|uniref:CCC domain-containing protein n=1 Tax=Brassicogethes aeneus TaxID=1431903 RepID=A0A9P0FDP9_BRAAE|nr:unnamed protein product [Brassicogethes aeneus]